MEIENTESCPKCGRTSKECASWKVVTQHFWPKAVKTRANVIEDGINKTICRLCGEKKIFGEIRRGKKDYRVCFLCKPKVFRKSNFGEVGTREYRRNYYLSQITKSDRPCRSCGNQRSIGEKKYCVACKDKALREAWKAGHKACKNRRKARLRGNGGTFTGTQFKELCERFGNRCLACGVVVVDLTVDHVIPLSKGGSNGIENIQPLCHGCNVKKSDQTIDYRVLRVA